MFRFVSLLNGFGVIFIIIIVSYEYFLLRRENNRWRNVFIGGVVGNIVWGG